MKPKSLFRKAGQSCFLGHIGLFSLLMAVLGTHTMATRSSTPAMPSASSASSVAAPSAAVPAISGSTVILAKDSPLWTAIFAASPDAPAASVDGKVVLTYGYVQEVLRRFEAKNDASPLQAKELPGILRMIVNNEVRDELMYRVVQQKGWDKDPDVIKDVERYLRQRSIKVGQDKLNAEEVQRITTDASVIQDLLAEIEQKEEWVTFRRIVVSDLDTAMRLKKAVKKEQDFVLLGRKEMLPDDRALLEPRSLLLRAFAKTVRDKIQKAPSGTVVLFPPEGPDQKALLLFIVKRERPVREGMAINHEAQQAIDSILQTQIKERADKAVRAQLFQNGTVQTFGPDGKPLSGGDEGGSNAAR